MNSKYKYFPVFIDITGYRILVVGGGSIASRRAKGLLEFGAELTVIAPEFCQHIHELKEVHGDSLTLIQRVYCMGDEDGFKAVLSAVDDRSVDQIIYENCRRKNIPVNIASDKEKNDFYFPALICDQEMVIGVCSGGRDHKKVAGISQLIREKIFGNN